MRPELSIRDDRRSARSWPRLAILVPVAAALGALCVLHATLAVLAVAGVIILAVSLLDLSILLSALLMLNAVGEPWGVAYQSIPIGGINLFPSDLISGLLLVVLLIRVLRQGSGLARPREPVTLAAAAFLCYGLFALARSFPVLGKPAVLIFRQQFYYAVFFFLGLVVLQRRESRRRLTMALFASATAIGIIGLHNLWTGTPVGAETGSHTYRYLSGLQALILVFALALMWATVWTRSRPLWSLPLGALWVAGILLSQARSVWLGAVIAILCITAVSGGWRRLIFMIGIPAVLAGLILARIGSSLVDIPVLGDVAARVSSIGGASHDVTTLWRLFVWSQALRGWAASPLFGLGLGRRFTYFDVVKDTWDTTTQLHNSYLELLWYAGAIGVVLLIVFQGLVLRRALAAARRLPAESRPVLLALAGCLICLAAVTFTNAVVESMISNTYAWILCAACVTEARAAERTSSSLETSSRLFPDPGPA